MYNKTLFLFFSLLFILSFPLSSQVALGDQSVFRDEDSVLEAQFWAGIEAFRSQDYASAADILQQVIASWTVSSQQHTHLATAANVYTLALLYTDRHHEALKAAASFHEKGLLDEEGVYNYGVAALRRGDFHAGYQVLSQAAESIETPSFDFSYLAAISAFNLGKWQAAEFFFKKSLNQDGNPSEKIDPAKKAFFQSYYLGLAQFRLGKLESAYSTLEPLCQLNTRRGLDEAFFCIERQQALSIALHCALQLYSKTQATSWWNRGCTLAHALMDRAESPSQRQEAVLLTARLYGDGGKYQQALELLAPYAQGRDELSLSCRFLGCELLVSQGKLEEAVEEYSQLAAICTSSHLASTSKEILTLGDKAAYRQGELLYSLGRFQEASAAFADYRRNHPAGTYRDAALYFNGEALAKEGFVHRGILQHETLLKQHPSSPYLFSSLLSLMDLYKKTGEYGGALEAGDRLLAQFPQQAQAAQIPGKMAELRLLEQGMELQQASLLAEFNQAGKQNTAEGRRLGLELAHFYVNSFGNEGEGEQLLLQILEYREAGEELVAAGAAALLGDLYRGQNRYQEAAHYFLQAAQVYLEMGSLQEEAASALYRGAESFDVAGMAADSQAVARQLASLFPQSPWTKAAQIFL